MWTNSVPFVLFFSHHPLFSKRNHEKVCTVHGSNPEMQCGSGNAGMASSFFFCLSNFLSIIFASLLLLLLLIGKL